MAMWVGISRGNKLPPRAVFAGKNSQDGNTYVGMNKDCETGKLLVDKEGQMYNIWCHGKDAITEGEILIAPDGAPVKWVRVKRGDALPPDAFRAGESKNDGAVYVCRDSSGRVGKLNLDDGKVNNLWYHSDWFAKGDGEILCVGPVAAAKENSIGDGGYAPTEQPAQKVDPEPVDTTKYNPDALCDGHKACDRVDWLEKTHSMKKEDAIKVVMGEFPDVFSDSWLPDADCDGFSAQSRAQWLVDNQNMTMDAARQQIRKEFPAVFGGDGNWWNPDALCDNLKAQDRAQWLVDNKGLSMYAAKQQVRAEFPAVFGIGIKKSKWERYEHKNCYNGNGGKNVDLDADNAKPILMSVDEAKAYCEREGYAGFTYAPKEGRMWRLKEIGDSKDFAGGDWDVYRRL